MQSISVFLDIVKLLISGEKMLMSPELKGCVTWFIYFLYLLQVRYKCAKFYHCRIRGTYVRHPRHPWAAPKMPVLNRVNKFIVQHLIHHGTLTFRWFWVFDPSYNVLGHGSDWSLRSWVPVPPWVFGPLSTTKYYY